MIENKNFQAATILLQSLITFLIVANYKIFSSSYYVVSAALLTAAFFYVLDWSRKHRHQPNFVRHLKAYILTITAFLSMIVLLGIEDSMGISLFCYLTARNAHCQNPDVILSTQLFNLIFGVFQIAYLLFSKEVRTFLKLFNSWKVKLVMTYWFLSVIGNFCFAPIHFFLTKPWLSW